jgi:hypothetical protein
MKDKVQKKRDGGTEDGKQPIFLNVYGAQESIPRHQLLLTESKKVEIKFGENPKWKVSESSVKNIFNVKILRALYRCF